MNFAFDEEQTSLGDTVARLLADHSVLVSPDLTPNANRPAWDALAELGLFAMMVPEDHGGAGLTAVDLALAIEAMGANLAPLSVAEALVVTDTLVRHGSDRQRQHLLPSIADGTARIAVAIAEEGNGDLPQRMSTTITDGVLNGSKLLVAEAADADYFAVVAQDGTGPALLLVPSDEQGISVAAHEDIDPTCAFARVSFDGVRIDPAWHVAAGAPQDAVSCLYDAGAAVYACLLTGIGSHMLNTAVEYARTRMQFGQPIGAFQAIKHRCADMAVALDSARSAAYYGIWTLAEDAPDRARAVSMAKAYAGEVVRNICNESIQVHGGMGFTWELGLHRFLRRAKVIEHSFGTALWHNERVLQETLRTLDCGSQSELIAA